MRLEHWLYTIPLRIRSLFRRGQIEQELDDELRDHVERQAAAHIAHGMSAAAARTASLRAFGGIEWRKEQCRDARGVQPLEDAAGDVRYALRTLARTPFYTVVAVGTLALGIGANTAMFSVVNAVLVRPLPYADPAALVVLPCATSCTVAPATFLDWKGASHSFSYMALAEYWTPDQTGSDRPEQRLGIHLSAEMFPLLGVQPMLGRVFLPEEEHAGRDHVLVASYAYWKTDLAADPHAVGRQVMLDGTAYTVIGVMPPAFDFVPFWATGAAFAAPLVLDGRINDRKGASLRGFARLAPGVTLSGAQLDMTTIAARLEALYPGTSRNATVVPLRQVVVGDVTPALLILLAAVGLVLLIACANVAHLQLTRAAGREREFALRAALGASRRRIVQQRLVESTVLSITGAALGLLLAYGGVRALVMLGPVSIPLLSTITVDRNVFGYLLLATAVSAVVFGIAPALRASHVTVADVLKEGSRGSAESPRQARLRGALVVSEFAMAMMLLLGAMLVVRSFVSLMRVDPGFEPRHVLSMQVSTQGTEFSDPARRPAFYRELLERIGALPGVSAVSAVNHVPLNGDDWHFPFAVEGRPYPRPGESPKAEFLVAHPGYFRTMQIPVIQGREFTREDEERANHVVIVNQSLARRFWPGADPIGRRLSVDDPAVHPVWFTVVGVAGDVRQGSWSRTPEDQMYFPYEGDPEPAGHEGTLVSFLHPVYMTVVLRSAGDPAGLTAAVQGVVHAMDGAATLSFPATMEQAIAGQLAQPRFYVILLSVFAAVAVCLAAVGVFGVISYSVARRTREIGVRVALGAGEGQVVRLVLNQGLRLALMGGAVGVGASLLLTRYLRTLLYEVQPLDPVTFACVPLLLIGVALAACWVPVRSALHVDPAAALRHD